MSSLTSNLGYPKEAVAYIVHSFVYVLKAELSSQQEFDSLALLTANKIARVETGREKKGNMAIKNTDM